MNLSAIITELGASNLTPEVTLKMADITGGYVSDLLSDVLAHAPDGGILVTIQVHLNVVAVAVHAGLAAVVLASDRMPEEDVRQRAVEEGVILLSTPLSSFDVVGKLYELGVRGPRE